MPDRQASDVTVSATPFVAIVSRGANVGDKLRRYIDPALSASSAVTFCPQAISTAERAELWGEGYGADEGPDAVLAASAVIPGFIMRPWSVVQ
jgi:hypothetical protein